MAEYINRRKAAEVVCKLICGSDRGLCVSTPENCQQEKMLEFYKIPAEDVAPVVHGKWEYNKDATDWGIGGYVCSECKNKNNNLPCNRVKTVRMFSGAAYCPNCGAKMDGGE